MPFDGLSEPMIAPVEDSDEVRLLVRAREVLERGWCKYSLAQARYFIPVPARSRFARRFCSIGALNRTAKELGISADQAQHLIVAVTGTASCSGTTCPTGLKRMCSMPLTMPLRSAGAVKSPCRPILCRQQRPQLPT
jgi:hypothetical protein